MTRLPDRTDPRTGPEQTPALELDGIMAGYRESVVLRGIDVTVHTGQVVALIGANGAGKTTTLRVASGLVRPRAGAVRIRGTDVTKLSPHRRREAGLCLIPEGRGIFRSLTVHENLMLFRPPRLSGDLDPEKALTHFPDLRSRLAVPAGRLSGGQQQMLALARAFVAETEVVLLDEVSMGLAPRLIEMIFATLRDLAETGMAILLVEQYVHQALALADRVMVLEKGQVTREADPADLDESELARHYLGGISGSPNTA
jgi:branched-chain amino acid transport system ATP-binding protein